MHIPEIARPETLTEATQLQRTLAGRVRLENSFRTLEKIAGIDVSYDIARGLTHAVVVLMRMGEWMPVEVHRATVRTEFPYIPGYLSFREIPAILEALRGLDASPELLVVDGQGIAHPRRLGIAAHLGVVLDVPSMGVAKSILTGEYTEPGPRPGDWSPLLAHEGRIGTVLRSKARCRPLFLSPGHHIDHETTLRLCLSMLKGYRLPEPTRIADRISREKDRMPDRVDFASSPAFG